MLLRSHPCPGTAQLRSESGLWAGTASTGSARLPKFSETSEGVWLRFYVESPDVFAPKRLDSIARGGSLGNTWPPQPLKAQRAATLWRSRVKARCALRNVWHRISPGFRVRPRGGRGARTCVELRLHSFGCLASRPFVTTRTVPEMSIKRTDKGERFLYFPAYLFTERQTQLSAKAPPFT